MSTSGFVIVPRDMINCGPFRNGHELGAFLVMISRANWGDTPGPRKYGRAYTIGRGELLIKEREFADDQGMHRNTLRSLLQRLFEEGLITFHRDRTDHRNGTVIRIEKYEEYQRIAKISGPNSEPVQDHTKTVQRPNKDQTETDNILINEDNEENGKREESLSRVVPPISMVANTSATIGRNTDAGTAPEREPGLPFGGQSEPKKQASEKAVAPEIEETFNRFWAAYPKRQGANPKQQAKAVFVRLVRGGTNGDVIVHAAERYAKEVQSEGKLGTQWVAHASTWLNQKRWSDYTADNVHTGNFGEGQSAEPEWKTNPNAWRHDYAPPWPDAPKNTRCGRWIKGSVNWARAL